MKGTSVSRSFAIVKRSSAKSPSVSSYEYQSREKSLAPTGMRHSVKPAPTPGANSSRSTEARSAAGSAESDVQPSSLKQAPKPSIGCSGVSAWTVTSPPPPVASSSACFCHGDDFVVTYHSAAADDDVVAGDGDCARRMLGAAAVATRAAAPLITLRRSTCGKRECRGVGRSWRHHNARARSARAPNGRRP